MQNSCPKGPSAKLGAQSHPPDLFPGALITGREPGNHGPFGEPEPDAWKA